MPAKAPQGPKAAAAPLAEALREQALEAMRLLARSRLCLVPVRIRFVATLAGPSGTSPTVEEIVVLPPDGAWPGPSESAVERR